MQVGSRAASWPRAIARTGVRSVLAFWPVIQFQGAFMSMQLQALIFDVDGTLADTELHGHRVAFNRAFARAGLDWEWSAELYGKLLKVTGGKERIRRYLDEYLPAFEVSGDRDAFIAGLHRAKNALYAEMVAAGDVPLRPGVKRLLRAARVAGVRLAIATTTAMEIVEALLAHCFDEDVHSWFEVIGAGDVVPAKKPAPDIYHYTLTALGLPPAACLALEDSANGVRSAVAAGIPTLVTVSDYTKGEDFSGAAVVVDQLGEPDALVTVITPAPAGEPLQWIDIAALRRIHRAAQQHAAVREAMGQST